MTTAIPSPPCPASRWAVVLAFILVYVSWGTTFLAIKKGVESFPPAIFGGCRVALAGILVMTYLVARRQMSRLSLRDFLWTALAGVLMFVGGNGLLTLGEISVASGLASVLGATTPLWIALLESIWPWGERLGLRGWFGLFIGLMGVVLLLAPGLRDSGGLLADRGPAFILGSSLSWAFGSVVLRYKRIQGSYLASAAYQMVIGGGLLILIGWVCGEFSKVSIADATPAAMYSFFHLVVFGSLVGFVAFVWLLGHVSATLVGTHSYVNPVVAVLAGWLVNAEEITVLIAGGMLVILTGVWFVRSGTGHRRSRLEEKTRLTNERLLNDGEVAIADGCMERAG